ncbi:MAG: hypothetical protein OEQ53_04090 [Saprospiraceae bacterium]|nr:hypothetical protein [Saprospiraceae bacterium]
MQIPYFADIHLHPSIKPFRYEPQRSLTEFIPRTDDPNPCEELPGLLSIFLGNILKEYGTGSQSNLDACQRSSTRVIGLSLYPPERNMFCLRRLIRAVLGKNTAAFGACFTRFEKKTIRLYIENVEANLPIDYCGELEAEYQYLLTSQYSWDNSFIIAENHDHLKKALTDSPNSIVGLMTIEGMHAIAKYDSFAELEHEQPFPNQPGSQKYQHYLRQFESNINAFKGWGDGKHAPLFVTFAHHFWNLFCGHARSFSGVIRKFALNQECGRDKDFTHLGWEVMRLLLSRENGRRTLVDIKHMSALARKSFYTFRRSNFVAIGDHFPLICSHAAVSGIENLDDAIHRPDHERKNSRSYFNTWSINLTNEDILEIYGSDGLIGIILHEDRMPGGIPQHLIKGYKAVGDTQNLKTEYVRLIMSNILHAVRVCDSVEAWNMLCLGSDLDGAINTMERYATVESYPTLANDIVEYFNSPLTNSYIKPPLDKSEIDRLRFGLDPSTIVEKIMFRNVETFLQKYFHDNYLRHGNPDPLV